MTIEVKGLIAGLIAALVVLGATFGISALVAPREKAPPAAPSSAATPPADRALATQIAQGHILYKASCASCHGADAGGGFGPTLRHENLGDAALTQIITHGKWKVMPAFSSKYPAPQVQALVAYIDSLKK